MVIDTCILLDFMAGKNKAVTAKVERLLLEAKAAISVITVFELLRGVESEKYIAQRKELINLCTILDLTPPISQRASDIYTHLKKKCLSIHTEDILIAATALHWHHTVITLNTKDFSRVPGLKLEAI